MTDKIKVICQSTDERRKEAMELFDKIKPLLDEGHIYSSAVKMVTDKKNTRLNRYQDAWYRDLIEYGESKGYLYDDYSGKRKRGGKIR